MKKEELNLVLNVDEMLDVQWCICHAQKNGDDGWRIKCQKLLDKVKEAQLNWIK